MHRLNLPNVLLNSATSNVNAFILLIVSSDLDMMSSLQCKRIYTELFAKTLQPGAVVINNTNG